MGAVYTRVLFIVFQPNPPYVHASQSLAKDKVRAYLKHVRGLLIAPFLTTQTHLPYYTISYSTLQWSCRR